MLVLEKAPRALRGGNTHYSGRAVPLRVRPRGRPAPARPRRRAGGARVLRGRRALPAPALHGRSAPRHRRPDRPRAGRAADRPLATTPACWMARQGIEMEPAVSLSAVQVGDTIKWSPGAVIRARHEGVGLSAMWFETAERRGVEVRYETAAVRLVAGPPRPRHRRRGPRARGARGDLAQARSCSAAAASRPIPSGARATSAGRGTTPRCAARATTRATACAWRSSCDAPAARAVDGLPLDAHRRRGAAVRRPQAHRQDQPPLVPLRRARQHARASASSTRARTSSSTRTRSSAASSWTQPGGVAWQIFDAKVTRPPGEAATRPARRWWPTRSGRSSSGCPSTARRAARTLDAYNTAVTAGRLRPDGEGRPRHARRSRCPSPTGPSGSTAAVRRPTR